MCGINSFFFFNLTFFKMKVHYGFSVMRHEMHYSLLKGYQNLPCRPSEINGMLGIDMCIRVEQLEKKYKSYILLL